MNLLREGLLAEAAVALSGEPDRALAAGLAGLGARTVAASDPEATALVHDAATTFSRDGMSAALAGAWSAVVAVAGGSLIPSGRGGKIVLLAPRRGAGEHAGAVRAGLENLARTLSIEWARYAITTTAITPGADTSPAELTTLVCFLLSRAGDYYSGCRFDLGSL
jgi:NAD(P)-dependent dehydrogenase (short-subunit alcohol dehydrogenase family)